MKSRFGAVLAVLIVGLIVVPAAAFANTISPQEQIAQLIAQIKALQAQLDALNAQNGQSNCVDIPSQLTLGSSGYEVHQLQAYLIQTGFLSSQYNTGYYGFLTAQAVGRFQMNHGVVTSTSDSSYGIMTAATRAAMACTTAPNPTTPLPTTSSLSATCSGTGYNSGTPGVNWHVYTSGGTGSNSYSWTLSDDVSTYGEGSLHGSGIMVTYGSSGTKHASVTVNNGTSSVKASCSTSTGDGNASAAIDQSSLSAKFSGPTTITGTASGVSSVIVYMLGQGYTNARDYATVNAAARGDDHVQTAWIAYPNPSTVSNGHWQAYFGGSYPSTGGYAVVVYDASSKRLLASGFVTVTSSPVTTSQTNPVVISSFNVSSSIVDTGQSITFSWSSNLTNSDTQQYGGGCYIQGLTPNNKQINLYMAGAGTGTYNYVPTETATYTLTCSSGAKDGSPSATKQKVVSVTYAAGLPQCPLTAQNQRGQTGTFSCVCSPGFSIGALWGGPTYYTDDSNICTAGAQQGQMNTTYGGEVDYTLAPGLSSYSSWSQNGINSGSWGSWPGSFQITGPKG